MIRLHVLALVSLLGVAASAPAQRSFVRSMEQVAHGVVHAANHGPVGHRGSVQHSHHFPLPVPVPILVPAPRGHWEDRCEQVLVPGYWTEQHVPPTYGWIRGHCGRLEWGIVDAGGCRRVWVPPHYEQQRRRVWVRC